MEGHLHKDQERIRYSRWDLSSTISQDDIAQHSAIASKFIKRLSSQKEASISIWITDNKSLTTDRIDVNVFDTIEIQMGEWTLIYDKWLLDKIYHARSEKLPNETGGILIGCHNMEEKRVYVVDTLLSPGDSIEYPTAYIRGIKDVRKNLDKIESRTAGLYLILASGILIQKAVVPSLAKMIKHYLNGLKSTWMMRIYRL